MPERTLLVLNYVPPLGGKLLDGNAGAGAIGWWHGSCG